MKVKVEREMPFNKVGDIVTLTEGRFVVPFKGKYTSYLHTYGVGETKSMIKRGWLSEVKEKGEQL